jgi:hypothetical protein
MAHDFQVDLTAILDDARAGKEDARERLFQTI